MTKTLSKQSLIFTLAFFASLLTATPASANDVDLPVLQPSSGQVSPTSIGKGGSISFSFRVTDDIGCCSWIGYGLYTVGGQNVNSGGVYWNSTSTPDSNRVSGSGTDSTYSFSLTVPADLVEGTYFVKAQGIDLAGRYTHLEQVGSFVISTPDLQLPVLIPNSGQFNGSTFAPGSTLNATFRITDDVGCCNWTALGLYTSSGRNVNSGNVLWRLSNGFTRVSGSAMDGVYSYSVTVPSNLTNGTYYVKSQATDLFGRYTHLEQIGSITVRATSIASTTPSPTPSQTKTPKSKETKIGASSAGVEVAESSSNSGLAGNSVVAGGTGKSSGKVSTNVTPAAVTQALVSKKMRIRYALAAKNKLVRVKKL